jgi:hypothetical protein
MPPIVKSWRAFPLEADGLLIGFHFLTAGASSQELVLMQLSKKYGAPTHVSKQRAQNSLGASFEALTARWDMADVVVTFSGITDRLDVGEVYIDLPAAAEMRKQWRTAERALERPL